MESHIRPLFAFDPGNHSIQVNTCGFFIIHLVQYIPLADPCPVRRGILVYIHDRDLAAVNIH